MAFLEPTVPIRLLLIGTLALSIGGVEAAGADEPRSGEFSELTVEIPAGSDVSISLGDGSVVVDLPEGSTYPTDFPAASGGLLRSAEVSRPVKGRVRLELRLAGGLFAGATYGPKTATLRFHRRVASVVPDAVGAEGRYVLGADDKLLIAVDGSEETTRESVVSRGGTVSAPFVGEIAAAGLTVDAFTARLTELLARDYLVSPKVDVQVLEYRSQWVMVTGEVKKAGRVYLHGTSTLKDALAEAEGYTSEAGETVTISRHAAKGGEPTSVTIDRGAFERGETNPAVRHGDIVTVEPVAYCFVNGEVRSPGNVRITRGLTLLRAISVAGGFTEWANRKEIQLSVKDSDAPPKVYNVKKLEDNPELDPPLRGGELIVVKRRFL
jgi:polysaccharide export outer membrane protein